MLLVGQAPSFRAATKLLTRISQFDVPTLIEGETGSGKDLAARAIHYYSGRRDRPFIPVNCGALPDQLVENELFGHERGAYTDARQATVGLIALADRGTLFLDEVEALSTKAQVTLLRFMQDQVYRPLGATQHRQADVRIIAASNQDLAALADQKRFRVDLLFRIKVMTVQLPPLRDRPGDARLLAEHFLDECAQRHHEPRKRLHRATIDWIESYAWPGNVRELENFIQRECLLADGDEIVYPRGASIAVLRSGESARAMNYRMAKAAAISAFDRRFLSDLLERAAGNVSRAAREAGKERRAFSRLLKKYGIRPRDFQIRTAS
jgi:DNA-binding NtrC family response regulator